MYWSCSVLSFSKYPLFARKVTQTVGRLKRESFKSRNPDARSKAYNKYKQEKARTMSQDSALNNFLSKTAFSNIVKCIYCKCNKFESEALVLVEDDINAEEIGNLRRCQKIWKCKSCSDHEREFQYSKDVIPFHSKSFEDKVLFIPNAIEQNSLLEDSEDEEGVIGQEVEEEDQVDATVVHEKKITVSFPCSIGSLSVTNRNLPHSVRDILMLVYRGLVFSKKDVEMLYLNQLLKYKQVELTGDRYLGKLKSNEDRTLSSVIKQANDGVIQGSHKWKEGRIDEITMMLKQTGEMAFTVEFTNPLNADEVVASSLVQTGRVVSVSHEGNGDLQQDRKYFVHTDHDSSVDCQDNCVKIELSEFLTQNRYEYRNVNNRDAPCYIASISQRLDSFIQDILKCQSSPLYSKEYFFQIKFRLDGVAIIQGVFWPLFLEKINFSLVNMQSTRMIEKELLLDLANDLDKAVSCSSDSQVIQAQFEISDVEARSLAQNVKKFQFHLDNNFDRNQDMPSLMTIICEVPENLENLRVSRRLIKWINLKLASLSAEELQETSTYQFLNDLYENIDESRELIIDGKQEEYWKLVIENDEYIFIVETKLKELMDQFQDLLLAPFYHFALWCVGPEERFSFVLKRLMLADTQTNSYNPLFLKACRSSIVVQPFYGGGAIGWKMTPELPTGDGPVDHEEISFHEVLALTDARKSRIRSSRPFAFVFSGPSKMLLMKKVPEYQENCFKVDGEDGTFYENQQTIVSRYFLRMNGKKMLVSEFSIHYQYIGEEKSKRDFDILRANIDNISNSEHQTSIIEESPYPEFVICENGDVLKKRKKFKVLKYPFYDPDSFDYKHSRVLLFYYPLAGVEDINEGNIDVLYESVDEENNRKVDENERRFLKNLRKVEQT